jgi:hypothetical protein
MNLHALWERITTTRYTRALEEELDRTCDYICLLRAENRALLNSILGISGLPPIPADQDFRPRSPHTTPAATEQAAPTDSNGSHAARLAPPLRRRSWQQVNRMLEFESAKKKPPETN